jgi:hypothetical protein
MIGKPGDHIEIMHPEIMISGRLIPYSDGSVDLSDSFLIETETGELITVFGWMLTNDDIVLNKEYNSPNE